MYDSLFTNFGALFGGCETLAKSESLAMDEYFGSDSGSRELDRRACLQECVGTFGQPATGVSSTCSICCLGTLSFHDRNRIFCNNEETTGLSTKPIAVISTRFRPLFEPHPATKNIMTGSPRASPPFHQARRDHKATRTEQIQCGFNTLTQTTRL